MEKVVKKRRARDGGVEYLVRWQGYSSSSDSWEPEENIEDSIVEEFEDAKQNGPAAEPYVVTVADSVVAPDVADGLVAEWEAAVCRIAAGLLSRQRQEFACRKLFAMSPCPAWVFCALQRAFRARAGCEEAVSDITSVKGARGGKFVEDIFSIVSTDLVSEVVGEFNEGGHGSLVVRENNTAVTLVPPLEFKFKARRQADANHRKWPTELIITGHFMCLVDRVGKTPRWAFDDDRAAYSKENKHAYKLAVAAAMMKLGAHVVPQRVRKFLKLLV